MCTHGLKQVPQTQHPWHSGLHRSFLGPGRGWPSHCRTLTCTAELCHRDADSTPFWLRQHKRFSGSVRYLRQEEGEGKFTTARARWQRAGGATWLTHFILPLPPLWGSMENTVAGKLSWVRLPKTLAVNILATQYQGMRFGSSVLRKHV